MWICKNGYFQKCGYFQNFVHFQKKEYIKNVDILKNGYLNLKIDFELTIEVD